MYIFTGLRSRAILLPGLILAACSADRLEVDVSGLDPKLEIVHFEQKFYDTDMQEIGQSYEAWKDEFPILLSSVDSLPMLSSMREDTFFIGLYEDLKLNAALDAMWPEIEEGFRHLRYYYPDLSDTRIVTYISGIDFQYPILLVDSSIFVSSDMYLGERSPYYAALPEYMRFQFQANFLPSQLFEQIASHLSRVDYNDASLLNSMIAEGKKMYFVEAMLYGLPDSQIIRYPAEKLEWCQANEKNMWTFFLEEDLLFSKDPRNKERFINLAPFSKFYKPIDQDSPGRVGVWVGWQIVRAYMRTHPEIGLEELMSNEDHQRIFKESTYKPL